jgi:molecular chaperone GrpE
MADEAAENHAAGTPHEDGSGHAAEEQTSVEQTVEALRERADENWAKYLRACAELDNFRKRSARDVDSARRYGIERLVQAVLPVRDSLEAGLAAGSQADRDTLLEGARATLRLLEDALSHAGVEVIDPLGEPFDPERHEAMMVRPTGDVEPDTVIEVIQKGYGINERVVRPARVIVSQAPQG